MEDNFISKNKLIVMKKGYVVNQGSECSNGVLFRKDSVCDAISRVSSHNKLPNLNGSSSFLQSPNRTEDSLHEFFDDVQSKIYNLKTERRIVQEEDIDVKREILYQKETIQHVTKLSEYLLKNNSPNSLRIKNNSTIFTTPRILKQNERRVFQEEYEFDEKVIAKKSKFLFISNEIAKIRNHKYTSVIQNEMDDVYKVADLQCNRNKSKLLNINEKCKKEVYFRYSE
jgi:cell division septum initiation protein DivIVA